MMPLQLTCKETTALVVAREDRSLTWGQRMALRLHMAVCATCPVFERQMMTMHHALHQWRHYQEDETKPPSGGTV